MRINLKNSSGKAMVELSLESFDYFFDVGLNFDIQLKPDDVQNIIKDYPKVAFDALIWGAGDTAVREDFFEALVKHVSGRSWSEVQRIENEEPHSLVKAMAKLKGFEVSE